ncbi:hypothetical protein COBT_000959 [Conglomerata obtusa]
MKLNTIAILKCQKCDYNSKLRFDIKKISKIERHNNTYMMAFLNYFTDNGNAAFNEICSQIQCFDPFDNKFESKQEMHDFLDSYNVIDGAICCDNCAKSYPIENGIADFLN